MKIKIATYHADLKKATYKKEGARKELTYIQFLGELISAGAEPMEAKAALARVHQTATEDSEKGIQISQLNEETKKLFRYFRWFADEKGATSNYIKVADGKQTYILSRNLLESAQAVKLNGNPDQTVYAWMYNYYNKLVQSKLLTFYHLALGDRKVFPPLSFYWEKFASELWKADPDYALAHPPKGITDDVNVPAFFYFDKTRLREGPHPAWDGWLKQFPKPCVPIFKAWVYSIFDPQNMGRQAIWLHDNGYTGKSSVIKAIADYLGDDAVGAISGGSMKTNFAFEPLYGKRLVTYGDCKEPNLIRTPKIHSLLGNDLVTIDRKGLPAFTARLHAKLLIASNISPEIDFNANNERTRLLYIPLKEAPPEVLAKYCATDEDGNILRYEDGSPIFRGGRLSEELFGEMDCFIHSCQKAYENYCPNGQDILVTQDYLNLMKQNCISEEMVRFQNIFKTYLVKDQTRHVAMGNMLRFFCGVTNGNAFRSSAHSEFARFKKFLADMHGIKQVKKRFPAGLDIFPGVYLNEFGRDKAELWEAREEELMELRDKETGKALNNDEE